MLALPRLEAQFIIEPDEGVEPQPAQFDYFQEPSPGKNNGFQPGLPAGAVEISEPGRGFTGNLLVRLSTESADAKIRYTTDGSMPTESSTLFNGNGINIQNSTMLLARSFEDGLTAGPVSEAGYIKLSSDAQRFDSNLPVVIMDAFPMAEVQPPTGKHLLFLHFLSLTRRQVEQH